MIIFGKNSSGRLFVIFLLLTLILLFCVGKWIVPKYLTQKVSESFDGSQARLSDFKVSGVTPFGLRGSEGKIQYGGLETNWDSLYVNWSIPSIFNKHIEEVTVLSPEIRIELVPELIPFFAGSSRGDASSMEGVPSALPEEDSSEAKPEQTEPNVAISQDEKTQQSVLPPSRESKPSVVDQLQIERLKLLDGRMMISAGGNEEQIDWTFRGEKKEESKGTLNFQGLGLSGSIFFNTTQLSGDSYSLQWQIQGADFQLPKAISYAFQEFTGHTIELRMGNLQFDGMMEKNPARGLDLLSIEATASNVILSYQSEQLPEIDTLVFAGGVESGEQKWEAGVRMKTGMYSGVEYKSFGLKVKSEESGVRFESEAIDWNYGSFAGKTALRGKSTLAADKRIGLSELEVGMNLTKGSFLSVEPFTLKIEEGDNAYLFKSSPMGLIRKSTIWIEDLSGEVSFKLLNPSVDAKLSLFNNLGQQVGTLNPSLRLTDEGTIRSVILNWTNGIQQDGGKAIWVTEPTEHVSVAGKLDRQWMDTMVKWTMGSLWSVSRGEIETNVSVKRSAGGLSGNGLISISDLNLSKGDAWEMIGVQGGLSFQINLFPRTMGEQRVSISSFKAGQLTLTDIEILFDVPTIGQYEIKKIHGKTLGGTVWLEPFVIRQLDEVLGTRLRFEEISAQAILDLLAEERFGISAKVDGYLPVGWHQGDVIIGSGILSLSSGKEGRLVIRDPGFIKENLKLGSDPFNLSEKLLSGLQGKGIDITTLTVEIFPEQPSKDLLIRIKLGGELRTKDFVIPIGGFVINNYVSREDLQSLLQMSGEGSLRVVPGFGKEQEDNRTWY